MRQLGLHFSAVHRVVKKIRAEATTNAAEPGV
ncbi:hypothetical protein FHS10_001651 [Mucilaginibacter dorajii]|nr:hypothetical protein [Mucilaginibacter dorajii]